MARFNYAPLARIAAQLIEQFGQDMTLETKRKGGSDWSPTFTKAEFTVQGVAATQEIRNASTRLVETTEDQVVLAVQAGVEPQTSDRLFFDGRWREISVIKKIRPGGQTLIYVAWLKS